MKPNRAYTHRFSQLATEYGCPHKLDEESKETPYLLTPLLNPDTNTVATTVTVWFDGETPWAIELAAALHREVWRGLCNVVGESLWEMASAVARAHDVATAELRAGTLPGVDE